MKRFAAIYSAILIVVLISSCSANSSSLNTAASHSKETATPATVITLVEPSPTISPKPSATPEENRLDTIEVYPTTNEYISARHGISFVIPDYWIGKCRVEEFEGLLSVIVCPKKPNGENSWSKELFSIVKKAEGKWDIYGEWEFTVNGDTYVLGICDDMSYGTEEPDRDLFKRMQKDEPVILQTVRSISGKSLGNLKRLWVEVIPDKTEYTTTLGLGIAFTMPESWIGKCRIVEAKDSVSVYFKPKDDNPDKYGDGFRFIISKKMNGTFNNESGYDGVAEFNINGITYFCGGATDVEYDGPENDAYNDMSYMDILDTIRAIR